MAEPDPFAEAFADIGPSVKVGASAAAVAGVTSGTLPVAGTALIASAVVAVLSYLGLVPAATAALLAGIGYLLTPGIVMGIRVLTNVRLIRVLRSGATVGADVEARLRRLHRLAVASLLVAVPHVWVLAQVADLWWTAR